MKRPLGLWMLLSAGVLWLNTQDVHGIRATSLIFSKSSTTTSTPSSTAASSDEKSEGSEEEPETTEAQADGSANGTKPVLTGIPQIDYIYDPNLPKELNGYNLSDYPFYERVPENITFKCDGLHDGFYASVLHKCQVYHHCLFGIRYDFLCANYTAFDQTLFNCNFVSNVDCENSKKFWNRNDDLYKTKSTTPPPIVYSFYTQTPPVYTVQGSPIRRIPQRRGPMLVGNPVVVPIETPVEAAAPPAVVQTANVTPVSAEVPVQIPIEVAMEPRRRMRPPMRVRPYYDYYDDYDEPPRYIRKRPRPRPYYDDDDYEYYEDRYYRRNDGRRRRPYDRPLRRYKERRDRYEDDDDYDEYDKDDRYIEEDDAVKRKPNRGGVMSGSNRYNSRRKPTRTPQYSGKPSRRPIEDDYEEYDDKTVNKKPRIEPTRSRNSNRRPIDDYDDDLIEETNYKKNKKGMGAPLDETKTIIRPNSGTIFDRPRVAPKINLPVPKNVADKYSYKAMSAKARENISQEENIQEKSQETLTSTTEIPDIATTVRGSFKRTFMSRRPTADSKSMYRPTSRKPQPTQSEEADEEIQEEKANLKATPVKVKNSPITDTSEVTESSKKDSKRSDGLERLRGMTRFNMYKTRHSLSTPETRDIKDSDDLTEIDDSINEA